VVTVPSLTDELQRMADDAARHARPLPAADVIRRGDRRRTITRGALGSLPVAAVAAAAAVAVLLPSGARPVTPAPAQLAAWTVTRQASGSIAVTIRELRDPAGLQARLRADGVPASVRFMPSRHGAPNPCQEYPASQALQHQIIQSLRPAHPSEQATFLVIHPSELPRGAGVGLQATSGIGDAGGGRIGVALVQASPQCTG
jgi:hypothetical protein